MPAFIGARRALASALALPVGPLWTPDMLGSAIVAWWDATRGITLNGSTVSAWNDVVAGISATQGTAAQQPTYSASSAGGKPALTFDGARMMSFTAPANFSNGNAAGTVLFSGVVDSGHYGFIYGGTGSGQARAIINNGGAVDWAFIGGDVNGAAWGTGSRCIIGDVDGAAPPTATLDVDGAVVSGAPGTLNTSVGGGTIGAYPNGAAKMVGLIQDIMVINRRLAANERAKIQGWESWANGKAGANLQSGHPYKSRPPQTSDP